MGIKKYLSLDKLDLFYEKLKTKMSSDNASTLASAKDYTNQELVDFAGEMNEAIDLLDTAIGSKASQSDLTALQTTVNNKANATHNHAISDVTNLQAQLDSKAEVGHKHNTDYDAKGSADTALSSANTYTDESVEALSEGFGDVIYQMYGNDLTDEGAPTIRQIAYDESNKVQANLDAHKNNKSNPHGVTASQIGADPAGSASAVQANVDALSSSVSSHTSNSNIHITADEKSKLSTLDTNLGVVEDKVDDHIANSDVHFTSSERTKLANLNNYSHPTSGVTAGTYRSVTVDSQGHVKSGSNPTTLAGYGITDAEKAGAVSTHNISDSAHSDIRSLINELATKVNNFLDVDDKTKDQLSELISLIEANKTDIESITSGKVNVSDIVNNLVTNLSDKPLSAAQGVELKILIDGLQAVVNAHETNTVNPHGVTASQIGLGNVDNTSDENKPVSTAQAKAIAAAKEVGMEAKVNLEAHTADKSNPHGITKAQINLGNVDNTSDEDKPVSTLQATAIADAKKAGTDAQASLTTHTGNKANPHGVTKEQIDLGNVPNVTTNNQTPTYTVASANAELKSGETLSTAFGKIAKAISSLISHLGSKSNPHSVTKSQVGLGNVDNTADANKSVKHATTSDTASTAATLTGLTATVAELNKLDGVTATAAELNYTDGVTSNIQTQLDGKQTTISGAATTITGSNLTASRALISNSSGKVAVSDITSTELGYLDGVTSAIQTQLNGKQATITGGATTIAGSNLTANRALVSDGSGKVAVSAVTSTELGYLDGVTSAIQTQLNGKLDKTTYEYNAELAIGSTGKVCIGKFPMYDSNISVEIKSTTNKTFNGTLVIATQNINTTGGGSYSATVYGDADNALTDSIKIQYSSGSNVFSVYINLPSWSKNLLHVQCVSLASTPTDIATKVDEIPSTATIVPTNALKVQLDAKVPTTRTVNGKALSSNISLSASDVGAAASSHNHAASEITSGTLSSDRLPTVPITKGGTGSTTASGALSALGGFPISGGTITGQDLGLYNNYGFIKTTETDIELQSRSNGTPYNSRALIIENPNGESDVANALSLITVGDDVTSINRYKIFGEHNKPTIANVTNLQTTLDAKVPTTRTVNGKALSSNISLSASDVGASPVSTTVAYKEIPTSVTALSSITESGMYRLIKTYDDTPSGANPYATLVVFNANTYIIQIYMASNAVNTYAMFVRSGTTSGMQTWLELASATTTVTEIPLSSGFTYVSNMNHSCRKVGKIVHVSVTIYKTDSTAIGTQKLIATLPSGYRPASAMHVPCTTYNGNGVKAGYCDVYTDGNVYTVLDDTTAKSLVLNFAFTTA